MKKTIRGAALSAAVVVALGALAAAASDHDAFSLAVLRRDGAAIPFATFDGRRWRNDWPPPQVDLTVPINVGSVPKSWWGPVGPHGAWDLWRSGSSVPLRVIQPDWVKVHCARRIALQTDYHADASVTPPDTQQPYPKDGVAVYPPHKIEPIEVVVSTSEQARDVMPVVLDAFNRAERETASRYSHPVVRKTREAVEPEIERMYVFGESPQYIYIEAGRSYKDTRSPDGCTAFALGTGWFAREGGTVKPLLMTVDVLQCDRVGGSYMLPLGVVRAQNHTFWIAQFSGWNHERYAVIELKPKMVELRLSTWGGGC
jgi:hypothetical protein